MLGRLPTTVTRPRRPVAWTRKTANPFSGLWKVTRSTIPVSFSSMFGILPDRCGSIVARLPSSCGEIAFLSPADALQWSNTCLRLASQGRTTDTMTTSLLVRHGAMRVLGTFDVAAPDTFKRGERVLIRTERGLECGDVIGEATPVAVALLVDPTSGQVVRRMTDDDRATLERLKETE